MGDLIVLSRAMPKIKIRVSSDVRKQKIIFTSESKIWKLYSAVGEGVGRDGVGSKYWKQLGIKHHVTPYSDFGNKLIYHSRYKYSPSAPA